MKAIAFVLIVIGIIMIGYTGFNYVTREKIVDAGPIQITKEKNHWVQWPPIAGGVIIVAGIIMLATSKRSNA